MHDHMIENLLLLQQPDRWTSKQLEIAKLKVTENVPAAGIVGDYTPEDEDPELEKLVGLFSKSYRSPLDYAVFSSAMIMSGGDPLTRFLNSLHDILGVDPTEHHPVFRRFLRGLVTDIMLATDAGRELYYVHGPTLKFDVPQLSRPKIKNQNFIVRRNAERNSISIPLAILSVIKGRDDATSEMARYEVPQGLLQTVIAYSQNPNLKQYTGFTVTLDRTVVRVGKLVASQAYLRRFWEGQPLCEGVQFYRSRPFNLLDRDGRKELFRLLIGVFRFLVNSEESKMTGDSLII